MQFFVGAQKLVQIEVRELFDYHNHVVPINQKERVTILLGPNGYGKTTILRILDSFSKLNLTILASIPFGECIFYFDDGTEISVIRKTDYLPRQTRKRISKIDDYAEEKGIYYTLKFTKIYKGEIDNYEVSIAAIEEQVDNLSNMDLINMIPELSRLGVDFFRSRVSNEVLGRNEVIRRYRNVLAHQLLETSEETGYNIPEWLHLVAANVVVRFIETNRLRKPSSLISDDEDEDLLNQSLYSTVNIYSQMMIRIITRVLEEKNSLAQNLAHSFPRRLIEITKKTHCESKESLRLRLHELQAKRSRLESAGLLEYAEDHFKFSDEELTQTIQSVLSVYADDENKKLMAMDAILERVELFKEIINNRFIDKMLSIDRIEGFVIKDRLERVIPLNGLSSGEQHEIVLFFDLIFRMSKNTLVLIDEPELSLHIAWQTRCLSDIERIAKLSELTVLLATHSPTIIDDRWDLTVELVRDEIG